MADLAEELKAVQQKLEEQALQLSYAQKLRELEDDVRGVKADVAEKWGYFKVAVTVGSVVLTVGGIIAGMVGFRTVDQAKQKLNDKIERNIRETNEFYGDVMASSVFFSQQQYDDAIPKLLKWFYNGHAYDKTILVPLLASLNITDDWAEARPVIKILRSDSKKFGEINDAAIYTIIGSIEVQLGMTDLDSQAPGDANMEMQRGDKLLERTYSMVRPNQNDLRQNILTNEWLYRVAKGEFDEARQYVVSLKNLPADTKIYSWKEITNWSCMKALARRDHSGMMLRAQRQWKELQTRYYPVGH